MGDYRYGLCDWLVPLAGPQALKTARELGYQCVQMIDHGGMKNNFPLNWNWVQDRFLETMEETGVVIHSLQLQSLVMDGWSKYAPDTREGALAMYCVEKGIQVCQRLGIANLAVENYGPSAMTTAEEFSNTAQFLEKAGRCASDAGVQLIFESFSNYEETMRLYEQCKGAFKLCYDNLNPLRYHFADPVDDLRRYDLEMIDHIHLKDAPEGYAGSVRLGNGAGLVPECCQILKERKYSGFVITENNYLIDPIGQEDPAKSAEADLQKMKLLLSDF